jgi:hypothetical protein
VSERRAELFAQLSRIYAELAVLEEQPAELPVVPVLAAPAPPASKPRRRGPVPPPAEGGSVSELAVAKARKALREATRGR